MKSKPGSGRYVQVAVAAPLRRTFTYLPPAGQSGDLVQPGQRVRVPFGNRSRIGLVVACNSRSELAAGKLRRVQELVDAQPLLPAMHLELLRWASDYYQHPIGEVILGSLPAALRQGQAAALAEQIHWRLDENCPADALQQLRRAPRQAELLGLFIAAPETPRDSQALAAAMPGGWRQPLKALLRRGWLVEQRYTPDTMTSPAGVREPALELSREQSVAVAQITDQPDRFQVHLLEGITGSGKTEVYLQAVATVLAGGRQALVLLPEIALTPQLIQRFELRFGAPVAVLHSGLNDNERLQAWLQAGNGQAGVILGTRSAIWTPLQRPGLIVVDEEHDSSYKQQDGFRYHARDVAIVRAQREQIPIVLGSATPSLESLHNARQERYQHLRLTQRAAGAKPPRLQILDIRQSHMHGAIADPLLQQIRDNHAAGRQALLFLNRRGYAPVLLCHGCGWRAQCNRCDSNMTWHHARSRLHCHHCGRESRRPDCCPECQGALIEIGHGTERVVQTLGEALPQARVARMDRDSTRRRGSLQQLLEEIHGGHIDILVGTQMLAKGHHFPNVALVGILETDGGLFSTDFRALERVAQLIVQVSGRAGRAEHAGTVVIQTHHPDHPLLRALLDQGYPAFAEAALAERELTALPPCSYLALLRAEAPRQELVQQFLDHARRLLEPSGLDLLGPVPAPQPRRSGRQRMHLLIQSHSRQKLQRALSPWLLQLENLPDGKRVRWSIDIDPQEMG